MISASTIYKAGGATDHSGCEDAIPPAEPEPRAGHIWTTQNQLIHMNHIKMMLIINLKTLTHHCSLYAQEPVAKLPESLGAGLTEHI